MPRPSTTTSSSLLTLFLTLHRTAPCVTSDNICLADGPAKRPLPGCATFAQCDTTTHSVIAFQTCLAGSIFDEFLEVCNWDNVAFCSVESCSPTKGPTMNPTTLAPTGNPTVRPSVSPTTSPTEMPTTIPSYAPSTSKDSIVQETLLSKRNLIENLVLVSYTSGGLSYPSRQYTFDDFYDALQLIILQGFGNGIQFLLNEGDVDTYHYGLVNLAAFLSQAMTESIQYDACDELNWQEVAGRYAISNSCGQEGRSYQDEICPLEESYMTCPGDSEMEITAISSGNQVRAPPPLTCRPGSGAGYYTGYWDSTTGTEVADIPYSNSDGRTDTEGCCWWGRGALSTRGICNLGKFNWHVGKQATLDGRTALYPNIDFCQYPEAVCSSDITNEIRWTIAFFEWAERVQTYTDNQKWAYTDQLVQFVDDGMTDDSFIESVSRVLSFGCHMEGCTNLDVRNAQQRKDNFYLIINDVFDIPSILESRQRPVPQITPQPTFRLDFQEEDFSDPTPRPQLKPVLAPSLEVVVNPQPGPYEAYEAPPISYDKEETEMPTYEDLDELISLEGNGGDRPIHPIPLCLLSCLVLGYSCIR